MTPKAASEDLLGLSVSQARILLLGLLYTDDNGKIDFDRLAKRTGLTLSSARTLYPKAKKAFREMEAAANTNNDDSAYAEEAPKKKKARAPAKPRSRKRKLAEEEPVVQAESDNEPEVKAEEIAENEEQHALDKQLDAESAAAL